MFLLKTKNINTQIETFKSMNQPITSLNLPENKSKELQNSEYNYCKDVDFPLPYWDQLTKAPPTKTALELLNEECQLGCVQTYIDLLDNALGGGIFIGQITEFCGEPGSGKTQICFQLCVSVQLPVWCGGLNGEAVYIDTNNNFASHRVKEVAEMVVKRYQTLKAKHSSTNNSLDEITSQSILEKILYLNVQDHVQLLAAVTQLKYWICEHPMVKLVVIDNICAPLKHIDGQKRTSIIYLLFQNLQKLAQEHSFAIVVTNNMTTRFNSPTSSYQTPGLGDSYYHRLNNRIHLSKKSPRCFQAVVQKNLFSPPTEIEFTLFS